MSIDDRLHWLASRYIASPQWVKTLAGGAYAALPNSLRHGSSYPAFERAFANVEIDPAYVRRQLIRTLETALTSVPAYRNRSSLLKDVCTQPLAVLRQMPLTAKEDIKSDVSQFLSSSQPRRARLKMFTGGSTSVPMTFFLQSGVSRAKELAAFSAMANRFGGGDGDGIVLALRGRTVPTAADGRLWMYEPIKRQLIVSSDHLEPRFMPQYLSALRRWQPRYVHAFPSALYPLVLWLRESGCEDVLSSVRCVTLFSESTFEHHMLAFRQFFSCRVVVHYGHSERVLFANTLHDDHRYHFWPHYGYFELLDASGSPVTVPGRVGEIVGTSFHNMVMPFVRYKTGDYAVLSADPHPLMSGSPVVERIEGRLQEFVVCADHRLITVTTIGAAHVQELENCLRIQFEQFEPGELLLRVVPLQPMGTQAKQRICEAIHLKTQGGCHVEVEEVESIQLTGRGKQQLLIQHLDLSRYLGAAMTHLNRQSVTDHFQ